MAGRGIGVPGTPKSGVGRARGTRGRGVGTQLLQRSPGNVRRQSGVPEARPIVQAGRYFGWGSQRHKWASPPISVAQFMYLHELDYPLLAVQLVIAATRVHVCVCACAWNTRAAEVGLTAC